MPSTRTPSIIACASITILLLSHDCTIAFSKGVISPMKTSPIGTDASLPLSTPFRGEDPKLATIDSAELA